MDARELMYRFYLVLTLAFTIYDSIYMVKTAYRWLYQVMAGLCILLKEKLRRKSPQEMAEGEAVQDGKKKKSSKAVQVEKPAKRRGRPRKNRQGSV